MILNALFYTRGSKNFIFKGLNLNECIFLCRLIFETSIFVINLFLLESDILLTHLNVHTLQ